MHLVFIRLTSYSRRSAPALSTSTSVRGGSMQLPKGGAIPNRRSVVDVERPRCRETPPNQNSAHFILRRLPFAVFLFIFLKKKRFVLVGVPPHLKENARDAEGPYIHSYSDGG